jgi:SH3-like domain-containing protein
MRYAARRWIYRIVPLFGLGLVGLMLLPAPDGVHRASWVGIAPKIPDATTAAPKVVPAAAVASSSTVATDTTPAPQVLNASLVVPQPADRANQPVTAVPLRANWSDYLPAGTPANTVATAAPSTATDGTVGGSAVNARSGPSGSNGVVFTLAAGEAVKMGETNGNWVHVYRTSGADGWVYGRYLTNPPASAGITAAPPQQARVRQVATSSASVNSDEGSSSANARLIGHTVGIGGSVAVRSRPGGDAVLMLEPGDRMQIVGARAGWLRVVTEDGTSGWVPG